MTTSKIKTAFPVITDKSEAARIVKREVTALGKANRGRTVQAAYAAYLADVNGLVGKGATWRTWGAYAQACGVAASTVSMWRVLGQALTSGVEPTGAHADLWSVLAYTGPAAQNATVAAAIREGATPAKIESVVGKIYNLSTGSKIVVPQTSGKGKGGKGKARTSGDGTVPQSVKGATPAARIKSALKIVSAESKDVSPVVAALAMVTALDTACKGVDWTREDWAKIESALDAIRTREVTLLAKREDEARKTA
jgi:hypothetical protein